MNTNRRPRRKFKPAIFFERHRPTGESLSAKIARANQGAPARPMPSLARMKFLEQPDTDDDRGAAE
jgi:hypothetical protein